MYKNIKKHAIFILIVFTCNTIFAQQFYKDSIYKNINLKEVTISRIDSGNNDAFTFYRSSKLSGTEDILSRIEGVNLIKRGAFGMEPTLRNYSSGQINITINGMKMYGACTDKMDPISVYIEPANMSKLDIAQGASGNSMGSTIGGHINFRLKEPIYNCHNTISASSYSQFSTVNKSTNTGAMVNINNTKFAMRLNTTFRKANDYYGGNRQLVLHSGYNKINVNGALSYKANNTNLLLLDYIFDKGWNIGYPALTMDVSKAIAHILSIAHRKQFLHSNWESKIYYNNIIHYMDDTKRPETIIHMDMPGWSNTLGGYSELNYKKNNNQLFNIRYDIHQAFTRADMTMYPLNEQKMFMQTLPGNKLLNTGLSSLYKHSIGKNITAEASARLDYYNQVCTDTFGILQWAGFGYKVDVPLQDILKSGSATIGYKKQKYSMLFTVGYGERLPTANERYGLYLYNRSDGFDYIGNVLLKPEMAKQFELKQSIQVQKILLTTTLFYHHINNYINGYLLNGYSAMTIGARGVKTFENIQNAKVTGFESTLSFNVLKYLSYMANARFTYGILSNNLPMQQVPPLKVIQSLRFQKVATQIMIEHIMATAQYRINNTFGEKQTPFWQIWNIRFAYGKTIRKSIWQTHIAIENILDINYREHLTWGNIPQPGRNFVIGLNYYFN